MLRPTAAQSIEAPPAGEPGPARTGWVARLNQKEITMEGRVRTRRRETACPDARWHVRFLRLKVRFRAGRPARQVWTVLLHLQRRQRGVVGMPFCGRRSAALSFEISHWDEPA
jgi:hypothetical protein